MAGFLVVAGETSPSTPAAAAKVLTEAAGPVLRGRRSRPSRPLPEFTAGALGPALKTALIDDLGLKPKVAFGPVRVAVTGRTVSPPLYESMELLGREVALRPAAAGAAGDLGIGLPGG